MLPSGKIMLFSLLGLIPLTTFAQSEITSDGIPLDQEIIQEDQITTEVIEAVPDIFPDIIEGSDYYVAVGYLKAEGLVEGYPDGLFRADQAINRAEALKVLNLAIPFDSLNPVEKPLSSQIAESDFSDFNCDFPDIHNTDWFFPYVCDAYDNGIVEGYPDGTFKPGQTINLVEALKIVIIHSGINLPESTENFGNVNSNDWFAPYTAFAKSTTIIPTNKSNQIDAASKLTRGDFSLLIYRFIQNRAYQNTYGIASYYGPGFNGRGTASGDVFNSTLMTAAHRTLPFGTIVEVTNLRNGKSIQVKINDRGPYVESHIIDLSTAAFEEIARLSSGLAPVEIQVISDNGI